MSDDYTEGAQRELARADREASLQDAVAALRHTTTRQEYRPDGWPLCVRCGDDELYSFVMIRWMGEGERPSLADCFAEEFRCYGCNWQGRIEPK